MRTKVCLFFILGFWLFTLSRAQAAITWTADNFNYKATDAAGFYYNSGLVPAMVLLGSSSEKSQANGDKENSSVATAVEPQQGVSSPGLSMASGAWGESFQDSTRDSGGATVYAYANNVCALDNSTGVFMNGQNVTSYIDRYFSVDSNRTYTLSASAGAPLDWSGTASGAATAPKPNLSGSVYLLQTDTNGVTTTVQTFSLATLLGSSQQVSVSLAGGDAYQLIVALGGVTDLGGESPPAGIVTTFNNLDGNLNSTGNIDGNFNAGTAKNPVTITASLSPGINPIWGELTPVGPDWYNLGWFGSFYISSTSTTTWIFHQDLGWLYPVGTTTGSIWFYDPQWDGSGGWWWTSASVFPWVYSATENEWLYCSAAASAPDPFARWFADPGGQWATH